MISQSGYAIREAPYHKLLQPGEHRIAFTYQQKDWEVPENKKKYGQLDFRAIVPNNQPLQLKLSELLQEHKEHITTFTVPYKPPDFRPLEESE